VDRRTLVISADDRQSITTLCPASPLVVSVVNALRGQIATILTLRAMVVVLVGPTMSAGPMAPVVRRRSNVGTCAST